MPIVHEEAVCKRYNAGWCSGAGCFFLLTIIGTLVLPFYAAFESKNLWMKTNTYLEQPEVKFKHNLLLLLETRNEESGNAETLAWTTLPSMQRTYERFLRASDVRAWPEQSNLDGKADLWRIEATVPLSTNEKVYGVQLLTFFDLKVQGHVFADIEGLAYVQHASALPGNGLMVDGSAKLHQKVPLTPSTSKFYDPLLNSDGKQKENPRSHLIRELLAGYASRNVSMDFDERFRVWETVGSGVSANTFCVNMTVRVEEQPVLYITQLGELLKWAWIQYFSLLAVVAILVAILKQCVFANQVLETVVTMGNVQERKASASSRKGNF